MSTWLQILIGLPLGAVSASLAMWLIFWHDAKALRATGLTIWETNRTLWLKFEADLIFRLRRYGR